MEAEIKSLACAGGAADVGIASVDRLAGAPSMDASYLLTGAKAVVSVMSTWTSTWSAYGDRLHGSMPGSSIPGARPSAAHSGGIKHSSTSGIPAG